MDLLCLGLSHRTAPLALREKLALGEKAVREFLHEQRSAGKVGEIVLLSTCNRVEIYSTWPHNGPGQMIDDWAAATGVGAQELKDHSYCLQGGQGANHLFLVASGLDSLAVGESQILGQVSQAYQFARACQTVGPRLSKLFQAAIFSAKRVQTETALSRLSVSIPALAVKFAGRQGKRPDQTRVLLVGAGEMAELAGEAFRRRGVEQLTVISRTLRSAEKLARRLNGRAGTLEQLGEYLTEADVLLSASTSSHVLITKKMVVQALKARANRSLVILDIAVPRNVHPDVGQLENVFLHDMQDLQRAIDISKSTRSIEIRKAEKIIEEEARDFIASPVGFDAASAVIRELYEQAEGIRQGQLQKTLRRFPNFTEEQQQQIAALTQSIVRRILHNPATHLRQKASPSSHYLDLTRELFGLDQEQAVPR